MSANSAYYAFSGVLSTDRPWIEANATVFQLFHDGRQSPVGSICDRYYNLEDMRITHIGCFGKTLLFHANWDMAPTSHTTYCFFQDPKYPLVEYHHLRNANQVYLEHLGHLYPIKISTIREKERCELAVYDSQFSAADGNIFAPLIGEIIIRRNQNRYACNIRIDKELPEEMRMAIISLPFSADILPNL